MPSFLHEILHQLFRNRPELLLLVLKDVLGLKLDQVASVEYGDSDLSQTLPAHQYSDAVFVMRDTSGKVICGTILEVQLKCDADKRLRWPHYVTSLRVALRAPCFVLVIAPSRRVARWAAQPISVGPGFSASPTVLGPHNIPVITDATLVTAVPELGVLSCLAHGRSPQGYEVATAAILAVRGLADAQALLYWEAIRAVVSSAVATALENFMFPNGELFTSEFARKHRGEGRVEGCAASILLVLDARCLQVSDAEHQRIASCTDQATLEAWVRRAATVQATSQLFETLDP